MVRLEAVGYYLKNPTINGTRYILTRPVKAYLAARHYRLKNPAARGHRRYFLRGSNGNKGTITAIATPNPPAGSNAPQNQQILQLLPIQITPQTIPTTGVARGKIVFGSGFQVPVIPQSNTTFAITIGGQNAHDILQDQNNPNIFYFDVPPGTAGSADVVISGVTIPGVPCLSATPPVPLTLPGFVQYTDDVVKGIKGFSDSNLVNIAEGKSYVDYLNANGGISNDDAVAQLGMIRDMAATTQMNLWSTFLAGKTMDQSAYNDLVNQSEQKIGDFLTTYTPSAMSSGSVSSGVQVIANTPDAWMDGPTAGQFTIARPASSTSSLTVNYTVGGTATGGTDYTTLSGSVVIPANQTTATVTVTPIQHSLSGASKTVVVTISTSTTYTVGQANAATVTIHDYNP